jgi:hypothetical protein
LVFLTSDAAFDIHWVDGAQPRDFLGRRYEGGKASKGLSGATSMLYSSFLPRERVGEEYDQRS